MTQMSKKMEAKHLQRGGFLTQVPSCCAVQVTRPQIGCPIQGTSDFENPSQVPGVGLQSPPGTQIWKPPPGHLSCTHAANNPIPHPPNAIPVHEDVPSRGVTPPESGLAEGAACAAVSSLTWLSPACRHARNPKGLAIALSDK